MQADSPTLHGFWGIVERAWSNVNDCGIRAEILSTVLCDEDLYSTPQNEEPDLELLRYVVEEVDDYLPFVYVSLRSLINELDERQRRHFFRSLEEVIGALREWDGEDLHLRSENVQGIRARCWVVIMGREIYNTLRSNPVTHAYLNYVESAAMYRLACALYFEVADSKKALKR